MKILVVDDDPLQSEWLFQELRRNFPEAECDLIATESEFREKLASIRQSPPNVVLLDVMLRWADVSDHMPSMPLDVAAGKYHRAGLRCQQLLESHEETREVPVILLTVLDEEDLAQELPELPKHVTHLPKTTDPGLLYEKIVAVTRPR